MTFVIRHDYHAIHHSGNRYLTAIRHIVWHDIEGVGETAAEGAGSWFENSASGGSAHFGCDCNSVQQYLSLGVVAWGAPYVNEDGAHIEIEGKASWTQAQWMKHKGALDRAAWLTAHIQRRCLDSGNRIPLRLLSVADLRANRKGIVTHAVATKAFGGSHTDPGPNFPKAWVLDRARHYGVT